MPIFHNTVSPRWPPGVQRERVLLARAGEVIE
jgi:hypothetical protein